MAEIPQGNDKQIRVELTLTPPEEFSGLNNARVLYFLSDEQGDGNIIQKRDTDATTGPENKIEIVDPANAIFTVELDASETEQLEIGSTYYQETTVVSPNGNILTSRLTPYRVTVIPSQADKI